MWPSALQQLTFDRQRPYDNCSLHTKLTTKIIQTNKWPTVHRHTYLICFIIPYTLKQGKNKNTVSLLVLKHRGDDDTRR